MNNIKKKRTDIIIHECIDLKNLTSSFDNSSTLVKTENKCDKNLPDEEEDFAEKSFDSGTTIIYTVPELPSIKNDKTNNETPPNLKSKQPLKTIDKKQNGESLSKIGNNTKQNNSGNQSNGSNTHEKEPIEVIDLNSSSETISDGLVFVNTGTSSSQSSNSDGKNDCYIVEDELGEQIIERRDLWVRNLSNTTNALQLKKLMSKYGKVKGVKIVASVKYPGVCRYGHVRMKSNADAKNVIKHLSNTEFNGNIIIIDLRHDAVTIEARPDENHNKIVNINTPGTSRNVPDEKRPLSDDEHPLQKTKRNSTVPTTGSASVLTFSKIKEEREKQRERDRERAEREDTRRKREETDTSQRRGGLRSSTKGERDRNEEQNKFGFWRGQRQPSHQDNSQPGPSRMQNRPYRVETPNRRDQNERQRFRRSYDNVKLRGRKQN